MTYLEMPGNGVRITSRLSLASRCIPTMRTSVPPALQDCTTWWVDLHHSEPATDQYERLVRLLLICLAAATGSMSMKDCVSGRFHVTAVMHDVVGYSLQGSVKRYTSMQITPRTPCCKLLKHGGDSFLLHACLYSSSCKSLQQQFMSLQQLEEIS